MISLNLCGAGRIRTCEAEAPDLQSGGINHSPTSPSYDREYCKLQVRISLEILKDLNLFNFYFKKMYLTDATVYTASIIVEDIGVEPMTYCVQGNCSSQLS